jgi:hypothetical protein
MAGVGGGVPSRKHNIRLGDVVVSKPTGQNGGLMQWDFGKASKGGNFGRAGTLNSLLSVLRTALSKLMSTHKMTGSKVLEYIY